MPNERIRPPGWLKPMNKVLTHGRRSERVRMAELPPDAARPVLREFPAQVPTGVDLMKRAGVLTEGTPDELEGLAGRLAVFRIDPIT
jgi:hypothetical protein